MNEKESIKMLGLTALITTTAYILFTKNKPESKKINGLNIDIDPELMVENLTNKISDQKIKQIVENVAKTSISKIFG